jgi:hypothetical protein
MSSKTPLSSQEPFPTAQQGQKVKHISVEDLSDQLTDIKVGIAKNAAMERLTNDLASKWEPHGTHCPQSKEDDVSQSASRSADAGAKS